MLPILSIVKESWCFLFKATKERPLPLTNFLLCSSLFAYAFSHSEKIQQLLLTSHFWAIALPVFYFFIALVLYEPVMASFNRAIIQDEEINPNYFIHLFGKREWKMTGNCLLSMLVVLAPSALLGMIVGFISSMEMRFFQSETGHVMALIAGALFVIALIFFSFRLALVLPLAAIDDPHPLKSSWKTMKGNIVSLIVISLIIGLPAVVLSFAAFFFLQVGHFSHHIVLNLLVNSVSQYFCLPFTIAFAKVTRKLQTIND